MNKKIKANTVKRFHYDSVEELKKYLYAYLMNSNFNLKLRAIGRITPFESVLQWFNKSPEIFSVNPNYLTLGLNIRLC